MDRVGSFLAEKTPRRVLALAAFLGVVVAFRGLLPLFVMFVAFAHGLLTASDWVAQRAPLRRKYAVLLLVTLTLAVIGAVASLGAIQIARAVEHARETFPQHIAAARQHELYQRVAERLPGIEKLLEGTQHYASEALNLVSTLGHFVAYALIAAILALIFTLERDELVAWRSGLDPHSLFGTLVRWFGHLADAVSVTVQLQVIVALCNTVVTLPLLVALGFQHKVALMLLIFVSGLVPVAGNIVSGTVLAVLAYLKQGWLGAGLFVTLTFVLHKIEAYYLNPRLTARHVALPGFLLVTSLVAWEHLLGFAGLFVSFPVLFVASRIRRELGDEDAQEQRGGGRKDAAEDGTNPDARVRSQSAP